VAGQKVIIRIGESETVFETKSEALAACKAMLARYRNGESVNEADSEFLRGLLERHPEAFQKIGCGVRRFFRDRAPEGMTDCFWLEREDGRSTDFSYKSCVGAKCKSLYQEFAEACRQAVQPRLNAAKKEHFERYGDAEGRVRCEVTGEMVASYESHLDHKKPMTFQVIVATFIAANRIVVRADLLSVSRDAQSATTFVDKDLEQKFRDFHTSVAILRIVTAKTNLSLGGSERITKPKRPVALPLGPAT
jgi:hypothetical protein